MTLRAAVVGVSLLFQAAATKAQEARHDGRNVNQIVSGVAGTFDHLSTASTIGDLLAHPAFDGHARLLLPWDDRQAGPAMPLSEIGSLLPYHSNVRPDLAVSSINRMIDNVAAGHQVFYDFYSDSQKLDAPARENTGLFFYRGQPGAPFAIIAPGGGFSYVGSVHEGFPYADVLSSLGYNAFVLKYRVGQGGGVATEDLAYALSYIFRNAEALQVSAQGYSLWGSSAGARMAASIGSHGAARFGGDALPKPSTVVMAYTSHQDHVADEPPTFVVVGQQDGIALPAAMERRVSALLASGARVELTVFPGIGHGFGLGTGTSAEGWVEDAVAFWKKCMRKE
jgi:acetyl esterase/lipase